MKLRLPGDLKVTLPDTLMDAHVPVGVLGVMLALSGARFYRLAIVAPGFALGVLAGLQVPGSDEMRFVSAIALGIVCDKEPLPWGSKIAVDINYLAATPTLSGGGMGILEIL